MNSIKNTLTVVDPVYLRLDERIKELSYNARRRVNAKALGINENRYRNLILKNIKSIQAAEIEAFCRFFNCSREDFLNPNYLFNDFRTKEEIEEDLTPLEKVV